MYDVAHIAGFAAAHCLWSVSEGETFQPLMISERPDGERTMSRLAFDDNAEGARAGREMLESNQDGAQRAVLVADSYLHRESGRVDALFIIAVEYGPVRQTMQLNVPYRPKTPTQSFAVHRLHFFDDVIGLAEPDYGALVDAFYDGVDSHGDAGPIWKAHLDASL